MMKREMKKCKGCMVLQKLHHKCVNHMDCLSTIGNGPPKTGL